MVWRLVGLNTRCLVVCLLQETRDTKTRPDALLVAGIQAKAAEVIEARQRTLSKSNKGKSKLVFGSCTKVSSTASVACSTQPRTQPRVHGASSYATHGPLHCGDAGPAVETKQVNLDSSDDGDDSGVGIPRVKTSGSTSPDKSQQLHQQGARGTSVVGLQSGARGVPGGVPSLLPPPPPPLPPPLPPPPKCSQQQSSVPRQKRDKKPPEKTAIAKCVVSELKPFLDRKQLTSTAQVRALSLVHAITRTVAYMYGWTHSHQNCAHVPCTCHCVPTLCLWDQMTARVIPAR